MWKGEWLVIKKLGEDAKVSFVHTSSDFLWDPILKSHYHLTIDGFINFKAYVIYILIFILIFTLIYTVVNLLLSVIQLNFMRTCRKFEIISLGFKAYLFTSPLVFL